jgi:hypothetical protein
MASMSNCKHKIGECFLCASHLLPHLATMNRWRLVAAAAVAAQCSAACPATVVLHRRE